MCEWDNEWRKFVINQCNLKISREDSLGIFLRCQMDADTSTDSIMEPSVCE